MSAPVPDASRDKNRGEDRPEHKQHPAKSRTPGGRFAPPRPVTHAHPGSLTVEAHTLHERLAASSRSGRSALGTAATAHPEAERLVDTGVLPPEARCPKPRVQQRAPRRTQTRPEDQRFEPRCSRIHRVQSTRHAWFSTRRRARSPGRSSPPRSWRSLPSRSRGKRSRRCPSRTSCGWCRRRPQPGWWRP